MQLGSQRHQKNVVITRTSIIRLHAHVAPTYVYRGFLSMIQWFRKGSSGEASSNICLACGENL